MEVAPRPWSWRKGHNVGQGAEENYQESKKGHFIANM